MSILIKGMEIPKVPTRFIIFADGRVEDEDDSAYKYSAVPVPKHGKLVDADAFAEKNEYFWNCEFINPKYSETLSDLVEAAPTVIPASDKDTNVPSKEVQA